MSIQVLARWLFRFVFVGVGTVVGWEALQVPFWPWRLTDRLQQHTLSGIDTHFVLIDVAYLSRGELAQLLQRLAAVGPRGLLLDMTFEMLQEPSSDSTWRAALCTTATRVPLYLAGDVAGQTLHTQAVPIPASLSYFQDCTRLAYVNLLFNESVGGRCIRYTIPYLTVGSDTIPSMGLAAAKLVDSTLAYQTIPSGVIPIRYRGNIHFFYYLSGKDVIQDTVAPELVRGKVLFLGLVDPLYQVSEDVFFSPLGLRWGQLVPPDMYGVVIHANMASMYIARRFWQVIPKWVLGAALGLSLLLVGMMVDRLQRGRWMLVRTSQVVLGGAAVLVTFILGPYGYWIEVEWYLLGLLLAGEVLLWTASSRR